MSDAGAIVDVVFKSIAHLVALTESDRKAAKEAVKIKLAEIEAMDRGPLGPRADAIRARYLVKGGPRTADDLPVPLTAIPLEHSLRTPVLPLGFELRDTQPPPDEEDAG